MLRLYIDDSRDAGGTAVVASAYLASDDQWESFAQDWELLLENADVPVTAWGTRVFHMTDFENSHLIPSSPFHSWGRPRKGEFMATLIQAIARHTRLGLTLCVPVHAYWAGVASWPLEYRRLDPFAFAAWELVKWTRDWANATGITEQITYFVDTVTKRDDLDFLMRSLESNPERSREFRLHRWLWATVAKDVPLQAADVLAYESSKEWVNCYRSGQPIVDVRKSLGALGRTIHIHKLMTTEALIAQRFE